MTYPDAPPDLPGTDTTRRLERCVATLLLIGTLLVYGYFFQGEGYNQNAQLDTIRALVERRTFEITSYARLEIPLHYTEDAYTVDGRIFSNKPPGLALVGAPVYAVIYAIERALGINLNDPTVIRTNAYLLTLWVAALPGALVVVALFRHLLANGFDVRLASLAAAGFAFGSLLFPYGSVAMSHNLLAACLFLPWTWMTRAAVSIPRAMLSGLVVGIGILTFLPVAPLAAIYPIELLRRRRIRHAIGFCIGPALAAGFMLAYNAHYYGSPFETGAGIGGERFYHPHLLLGYFDWPDLRRLYWITFHPFRGLFYSCPIFILCLLALLKPDRAWLRRNVLPAFVVAWFLLFYLTFNGWPGGWSVGVRYAIPALPFLFLFAVPAIARYRTLAIALIALSTFNMLAVTAYNVMAPGNSAGAALEENPIAESLKRFTMNWIARNPGSFNLGMVIGIKGVASAVPAALMIAGLYALLSRLAPHSSARSSRHQTKPAGPEGPAGRNRTK